MLEFAKCPIDDRSVYFEEVASRRGITRLIVEKDFWVSFTLRLLFDTEGLADALIFKGGTSLSKVFGIIKRFSEDIDLTINPDWLGYGGDKSPEKANSLNQAKNRQKKLNKACIRAIQEMIQPNLEHKIYEILGHKDNGKSYLNFFIDSESKSPVLLFHYPTQESGPIGYIHPQVKLEFGSRTSQEPTETYSATSWVAEEFPNEFKEPHFNVNTLAPERTFWEKAIILHTEHHRQKNQPLKSRLSRHVYDLCQIASHESGQQALSNSDLRENVVDFNKTFFDARWKNLEAAKSGKFCLVPPDYRLQELKRDYEQMNEMFIGEAPNFNELLIKLKQIEDTINSN